MLLAPIHVLKSCHRARAPGGDLHQATSGAYLRGFNSNHPRATRRLGEGWRRRSARGAARMWTLCSRRLWSLSSGWTPARRTFPSRTTTACTTRSTTPSPTRIRARFAARSTPSASASASTLSWTSSARSTCSSDASIVVRGPRTFRTCARVLQLLLGLSRKSSSPSTRTSTPRPLSGRTTASARRGTASRGSTATTRIFSPRFAARARAAPPPSSTTTTTTTTTTSARTRARTRISPRRARRPLRLHPQRLDR